MFCSSTTSSLLARPRGGPRGCCKPPVDGSPLCWRSPRRDTYRPRKVARNTGTSTTQRSTVGIKHNERLKTALLYRSRRHVSSDGQEVSSRHLAPAGGLPTSSAHASE